MAESRKLENLKLDQSFLRGVVDRCLTLRANDRRRGEEVDHFSAVLALAVHETLRERGVEPRPYVGVIREFIEDLYVPAQVTRADGVDEDSEATRILKRVAPAPGSLDAGFLDALGSLRRSVEQHTPQLVERLTTLFHLKLLAGGLDLREQVLLGLKDSKIDPLTQLLNRRGMDAYMTDILRRNPAASGGVLLVDVDHFKAVNDTHGHDTGDQALAFLAGKISETVRMDPDAVVRLEQERQPEAEPTTARWGGEEILVALPGVETLDIVHIIAERVRGAVGNDSERVLGFPLTVSIGATLGSFASLTDLYRTADGLLYRAKGQGRNQVVSGVHEQGVLPSPEHRAHFSIVPSPSPFPPRQK